MKPLLAALALCVAVALGILLAQGCTFQCNPADHPTTPTTPGGGPGGGPTGNPVEKISYAEVSSTILVPICGRCHGNSGGYNFQSYPETMKAVKAGDPDNSLLCFEVKNALMPPSGPRLTDAQVNLICNWIAQGATQS